jgi:hypothetical protein
MLVEKWNHRTKDFLKYLMGEVLPYLEPFQMFHKQVCVYICGTQSFWYDMIDHVANTKFQRLLYPCSDHGNSSFYNMRPNDYS